jgi:hypothetical protein
MTEEIGRPILCRVIDPDLENGGRDDWRTEIVSSYPKIFQPPEGLPECLGGWRHLIHSTCRAIEDALKLNEGNTLKVLQINQRYGVLNIYWEGTLSARARTEVERAIEWAYIKSAYTCEICGFDGRIYNCAGWLLTACTGHGRGKPAPRQRRADSIRVVLGTVDGQARILSCRQYERMYDCFCDIPPDSLEIDPVEERKG